MLLLKSYTGTLLYHTHVIVFFLKHSQLTLLLGHFCPFHLFRRCVTTSLYMIEIYISRRKMTKKSSKNPRIPKRASGRKSRGEARYSKAPIKQRNILMRNIQKRPPTENISLKACRNKVGRSIILSIICKERTQKLVFCFSNSSMLN